MALLDEQLRRPSVQPERSVVGPRPRRGDQAVMVGLAGTVIVHLLLFWAGPQVLRLGVSGQAERPAPLPPAQELDVQLVEEPELIPPRLAFIETNPAAPANAPDRPDYFSFQDSQAASPHPVPGKRDQPKVAGEDRPSSKIIEGALPEQLAEPSAPAAPATPPTPPQIAVQAIVPEPAAERRPPLAPDEETRRADDPEGVGAEVSRESPRERPDERVAHALVRPGAPGSPAQPDRNVLLPRPRVSDVLPGVLQQREGGTSRVGVVSVNAKFLEYGEYLKRMFDAIQIQWYRLISDATFDPAKDFGKEVRIRYVIDQEGEVVDLEIVGSTARPIATLICRDAIQSRSPFGPFTEQMRRTLGAREEIVVQFNYY